MFLPHKAVGSETIARWIKATLKMTGVNTEIFHAHSTRAATCSAASRHGVSLDTILTPSLREYQRFCCPP